MLRQAIVVGLALASLSENTASAQYKVRNKWRRMQISLAIATAAAVLATISTDVRAERVCPSETDLAALDARVLQTELMVAALTCGQQKHYNAFVQKFSEQLVQRGQGLRQLFLRASSGNSERGEEQLDEFVTKLANEASARRISLGDSYCTSSAAVFLEAFGTSPQQFSQLTAEPRIRVEHGYRPCSETEMATIK